MIVNVFVAFHESELSFSRRCSWLKGAPPGTRTLAAGIQKKQLQSLTYDYIGSKLTCFHESLRAFREFQVILQERFSNEARMVTKYFDESEISERC